MSPDDERLLEPDDSRIVRAPDEQEPVEPTVHTFTHVEIQGEEGPLYFRTS